MEMRFGNAKNASNWYHIALFLITN